MILLAQSAEQIANPWFFLKEVNASLNTLATILIVVGFIAIKQGKEGLHKKCMLAAAAVSALFLVSYLIYHGQIGSVGYTGEGPMRVVYFVILISHIILAAVQMPMIILTILWGLQDKREKHRKLAKITLPVWLYVSVTGVVVYLMLYG
ncbi:MAG: DUF420 domain-containing protein [Planctomycetota bacterium]|jgi:uncharacterized membrane protein YozB (DUF420 family)